MGAAAFLSCEGAGDDGLSDIKKRQELEGLHKIRVKYPPFVLHRDGSSTVGQCLECQGSIRHRFVSPNEAKIETHQLAEFFPNLPGSDRSFLSQQALDATLFG